jgi:hypothetical protein
MPASARHDVASFLDNSQMNLRIVNATRYVTPLREGGSLPAIVEADDDGLYVLKFRGAGQGPKVLIAELIVGEIARAAGFAVPEIVLVELDPELARTEPDPEIQQLIRASAGRNLALDYLPGSVTFNSIVDAPDSALASSIVWLDAYVSNVDRTARNANMLMWHRRVWLIDHGAALYFHHAWGDGADRSQDPFVRIKDHILLDFAGQLREVDAALTARITPEVIRDVVGLVPEEWLTADSPFATPQDARDAYIQHLTRRLRVPRAFLEEAVRARSLLI